MSDLIDRKVVRPMCLTEDDLIRHLKCVGLTIEHDAYSIGKFPERTRSIEISAIVSPGENVTTVEYRIERTADPRANKDVRDWLAEDLREEEHADDEVE